MFRTLLRQVKQYRRAMILTPIWTSLEVVMGVLIPYVTASIIDKGISAGNLSEVYRYGFIMVCMACLSLLFGILAGRYAAYSSTGLAANLREAMYGNIQKFSFSDIDKYSTAGLVTRMTTDVSNIQNATQMLLRTSFRAPMNLVFSVVMCLLVNVKLSLVFMTAMLILGVFLTMLISRAAKLFSEIFRKYDDLNGVVKENIDAIKVVKAYAREDHEMSKFDRAALSLYTLNVKAESLMALNGPVMNLIVYACMIALSWFGAHFIVGGSLTTGQLTSLFTYVMTIMSSLMMLSMIFVQLTQSAASGQRIAQVINEVPDMEDPREPLMEVRDGSVDFNHVWFTYKGAGLVDGQGSQDTVLAREEKKEWALEDIDLHVRAGETIGVIGGTGSGKSSLGALIPRLYDASRGNVEVGGEDVRNYNMEALREEAVIVLQHSLVFSGTILDNLRWGRPDASEEECINACRLACADEFISAMPDGYNTVVEQGGANLSGGQKQRLCIARALLKNPKVLILDDSTSAVDTATDSVIRRTFAGEMPGVTKFIISQRVLSIMDADRIVVMDAGRIIGCGTHEELLESNEVYRDIYQMQTSGGEGDFDSPVDAPNEAKEAQQ
ncbi:MAG: ABC transporter ATP-binding protein [Bacteroidales bacterium]|nr:ABC transporter ATP-binding protein [Bacteroidales bacterium]